MLPAMRCSILDSGSVLSLFIASLKLISICTELGILEHTYATVCPTKVIPTFIDSCPSIPASRSAEGAAVPTMVPS